MASAGTRPACDRPIVVAMAASAKRRMNKEGGMDHLDILPINKAPVRKGEADLRPALVAPTSRGGWTIAG